MAAIGRIGLPDHQGWCYCEGPNIEKKSGFDLSKANLPSYIYLYIQYIYICIKTHFSVFSID